MENCESRGIFEWIKSDGVFVEKIGLDAKMSCTVRFNLRC